MPPEVGQETVPLFLSRTAALAEIEAEQAHIARPLEITKIIYYALRTPGTAWPTDQNGNLPEYLKRGMYAATTCEFLSWARSSCPSFLIISTTNPNRKRKSHYLQRRSLWNR